MITGTVISIYSHHHLVRVDNDDDTFNTYECKLKGTIRLQSKQKKHPCAVGDKVDFTIVDGCIGLITNIHKRHTVLSRSDHLNQRQEQTLAANIDRVLIVTSIASPLINPKLIDRYIIASHKGNIPCSLIINKIDLTEDGIDISEIETRYRNVGIPVFCVSVENQTGIAEVKEHVKDQIVVFSGASGVGKSSIINCLQSEHQQDIKEIHRKTNKGRHSTTRTVMLPLTNNAWVIDTPGIRSFGLWQLSDIDVKRGFSEIYAFSHHCQYRDCYHINEPNCAVKKALEENEIHPERYESYIKLLNEVQRDHKRQDRLPLAPKKTHDNH